MLSSAGDFETFALSFAATGDRTTLTNQANAVGFFNVLSANIHKLDLCEFEQVRMVTNVFFASTSANTPKLRAAYALSVSSPPVIADFSADLGASAVTTSLASTGLIDSGWVSIAALAKTESVFVTIEQSGGDGSADPSVGTVTLYFRRRKWIR